MCRRPLAGFFSRMCTGTPMASPNCPAAAQTRQCVWMSLLQEGLACCLCPVSSGHALRAVQPASESACSFLFLQPSVHSFCTPSVHLLYTFCTPSVHLLHILYISGRSTNPIGRHPPVALRPVCAWARRTWSWIRVLCWYGVSVDKWSMYFHTTLAHTLAPPSHIHLSMQNRREQRIMSESI